MALQSSGPISLGDIQKEYGGNNPDALSEYYFNKGYVNNTNRGKIPSSGTNKFSNYYGGKNIVTLKQTITFTTRFKQANLVTFNGRDNTLTLQSLAWTRGMNVIEPARVTYQLENNGSIINSGTFTSVGSNGQLSLKPITSKLPFQLLKTTNVVLQVIKTGINPGYSRRGVNAPAASIVMSAKQSPVNNWTTQLQLYTGTFDPETNSFQLILTLEE